MADGFTLRDFNKMSEEEVEEVTKGLPGFENMLSNLKKKDEGEKPTGSFFTQAYGTLPSKIEGVKNPYAGTTIFDPKAKPLEERTQGNIINMTHGQILCLVHKHKALLMQFLEVANWVFKRFLVRQAL